jgi:hypothetical protein
LRGESEAACGPAAPDALLAVVPEVVPAACKLALSDCACKAAARLWRNSWRASAVESALEDEASDADVVEEDAALQPESVVVLEVELPSPMDCNASMMAPMKPPSGGGEAEVDWVVPPLLVAFRVFARKRDGSHCVAALAIELTLTMIAPLG